MNRKNNIYPQVRFFKGNKFDFLFTSLFVRGFQITFDPHFAEKAPPQYNNVFFQKKRFK
jgi:hypothetical protein